MNEGKGCTRDDVGLLLHAFRVAETIRWHQLPVFRFVKMDKIVFQETHYVLGSSLYIFLVLLVRTTWIYAS